MQRQAEPWRDDVGAVVGLMDIDMENEVIDALRKHIVAARLQLRRGPLEIVLAGEGLRKADVLAIDMDG